MSNTRVTVLIGAGSIGLAIARRISAGKHIVVADLKEENARAAARILEEAGFSASHTVVDVGSRDTLHAYQIAKRGNGLRVRAEAVKWAKRGARINAISPGIIMTPLARDELTGERASFYQNMLANIPAGRAGTPDEVANVAELLMTERGAFITGSDFLADGGATASYFYGPLQPAKTGGMR